MNRTRSRVSTNVRWLVLVVLFLSCESKSDDANEVVPARSAAATSAEASSQGATGERSSTAATSRLGASAADTSLAEARQARVRALVERWQTSQNRGDFVSYEKLFAERFTGIKRVGARTQRFNREGWLKDRKQMFVREFAVKVDDLLIQGEASSVVQFTQTWTSANFQDTGKKRLVIVEEHGELVIASEEMLDSRRQNDVSDAALIPDVRDFAFVLDGKGDTLLLGKLENLNAVTAHPVYVSETRAERAVVLSALPKAQQSLVGERFALFNSLGKRCEAVIDSLFVQVAVEPHFGVLATWDGLPEGTAVVPKEQRALELWRLSAFSGRFLAARLKTDEPCAGAIWARSVNSKPAEIWKKRVATSEENQALMATVRQMPEYVSYQKEYVAATGQTNFWDETSSPRVFDVFENQSGASYAALSLRSTFDQSCASAFDPELWVLLKKHGKGYRVISAPMDSHVDSAWPRYIDPLHVDTAFDLDGDGVPEFASGSDLFRNVDGKFRAVHNLSPGYFSCPC